MRKRIYQSIVLIAIILLSSLILFSSSDESKKNDQKELCSKKVEKKAIPEGMIWESLPRQFFSLPGS